VGVGIIVNGEGEIGTVGGHYSKGRGGAKALAPNCGSRKKGEIALS